MFKSLLKTTALSSLLAITGTSLVSAQEAVFTDEEKAAIKQMIQEEISKNPELIIQSLTEYEVKMQQEESQKIAQSDAKAIIEFDGELFSDSTDPNFGDAKAPVVVEFFDYNCGYCRKASSMFSEVIEETGVRRVYKEFPILGEDSLNVARLSLAIWNTYPEKYEAFQKEMLSSDQTATIESAKTIIEKLAMDYALVEAASKERSIDEKLMKNLELATNLNVTGTPTFVTGKAIIRGLPTKENLLSVIPTTN